MSSIASSLEMKIIEIVLYFFHLSVLILLIAKRKITFNGAFYHIFRIVLFADLFYYAIVGFFHRKEGKTKILIFLKSTQKLAYMDAFLFLFHDYPYFASFRFNFLAFLCALQYYGHTFMAFNRFTIIWFPVKHKNFWERKWYILLLFILAFLQVCWRLHEPGTFVILPDNGSYTFLKNPIAQSIAIISASILYISTTIIAAVLNGLSIIKFCVKKNIASSNVNFNEKRLLFVSCIIFIAQLLRTLCTVLRSIFLNNSVLTVTIFTSLPIMSNIFAWSGSVSLLLLSPTMRKEYLSLYLCKKAFNNKVHQQKINPSSVIQQWKKVTNLRKNKIISS